MVISSKSLCSDFHIDLFGRAMIRYECFLKDYRFNSGRNDERAFQQTSKIGLSTYIDWLVFILPPNQFPSLRFGEVCAQNGSWCQRFLTFPSHIFVSQNVVLFVRPHCILERCCTSFSFPSSLIFQTTIGKQSRSVSLVRFVYFQRLS